MNRRAALVALHDARHEVEFALELARSGEEDGARDRVRAAADRIREAFAALREDVDPTRDAIRAGLSGGLDEDPDVG